MILLDPAHQGADALTAEKIEVGRTALVDRTFPDSRYLVLSIGGSLLRLLFRNCCSSEQVACSVLTGPDFELRIGALRHFHEALSGTCPEPSQARLMPTTFQQSRLNLMLRIIDHFDKERADLAPVREVAREVVYPHSHFANIAEWKTSSERRRTQRLIEEAKSLTERGYLSLLKGRMPERTCCN